MLAVSIGTTDLASHLFGPLSHEYQDMVLRLDRAIAALLSDLDKQYKPGEVMVLFTADHGAAPIPDEMAQRSLFRHAGQKPSIRDKINKALSEHFGVAGDWVVALEDPSVYLSPKLIAQAKADPSVVEEVAGRAALDFRACSATTRARSFCGAGCRRPIPRWQCRAATSRRAVARWCWSRPRSAWGKYGDKELGTSHGSLSLRHRRADHLQRSVVCARRLWRCRSGRFRRDMSHVLRTPPAAAAGRPLTAAL